MTPFALGAVATAGGGAVALLVGWWLRDRGARRTERVLRDGLTAFSAYTTRLEIELAEAERIIRDLTAARETDAAQQADGWPTAPVPVPPQTWVALQEARENWEAN